MQGCTPPRCWCLLNVRGLTHPLFLSMWARRRLPGSSSLRPLIRTDPRARPVSPASRRRRPTDLVPHPERLTKARDSGCRRTRPITSPRPVLGPARQWPMRRRMPRSPNRISVWASFLVVGAHHLHVQDICRGGPRNGAPRNHVTCTTEPKRSRERQLAALSYIRCGVCVRRFVASYRSRLRFVSWQSWTYSIALTTCVSSHRDRVLPCRVQTG